MAIMAVKSVYGIDYLKPNTRLISPDKKWEVWVKKNLDLDNLTAEFYVSPNGSNEHTKLTQNERHFGAEWSPDSKVLLVYDNYGSGSSDTIIYKKTGEKWLEIYRSIEGFHIIWRLDKWLPGAVQIKSNAGGGSPDKVPQTVIIQTDTIMPNQKLHPTPFGRG